MKIRIATINDLAAITEIYNQAIPSNCSTGDTALQTVDDKVEWFNFHRPDKYPIYIVDILGVVVGWNSLSPYRMGRGAFRFTAETSYYIHKDYQGNGIGGKLLSYVIKQCPTLKIKTLLTFIMEHNTPSINMMKKFGFESWAYLPAIADFDGDEKGHTIYGKRLS